MLTWLSKRPATTRRAAKPAQAKIAPPPAPVSPMEEDLPPPFFADADPAFLDLTETPAVIEQGTPPPLPPAPPVIETMPRSPEDRLATALRSLPPWPNRQAPRRTDELLEIFRQLDRIAGDVCSNLEDSERDRFERPRQPR